jgi:hypothetical protein
MFSKSLTAVVAFLLVFSNIGSAFVLLGPGDAEGNPAKTWQSRGENAGWSIGYDFPGDIGAPVDPLENYRWNIPVITYAYDEAFIGYFGTNGIKAIDEIFQLLNDLPPASRMSEDLSEFPLNTLRHNFEAAQLGLLDIKSCALSLVLEELGLAQATRWVWSLHHREPLPGPGGFGAYDVIRYNVDPVTLDWSSYVNESLYTYFIQEVPPPGPQTPWSDAVEELVPPDGFPNLPATALGGFSFGNYYVGLTRDDVGGLRYLWRPKNIQAETLLAGSTPGGPGGWNPFLGTNFLGSNFFFTNIFNPTNGAGGTNNLLTAGVRPGVDEVRFRKVHFDPLLGWAFTPITNVYTDRILTPNGFTEQQVRRPILDPDFIFTVADLGQNLMSRTTTASWLNNDLLTPHSVLGGPGIIVPPVTITFNMVSPIFQNSTPTFIREPNAFLINGFWATFDGTTNAPIIYPERLNFTIRDLINAAEQEGGF